MGYYCMDYFRKVCPSAMNSNVRKPSIAVTSVSSSIDGKQSIGDVLRKAKKELIIRRICFGLLILLFVLWVVYLFVSGTVSDLLDASFALID